MLLKGYISSININITSNYKVIKEFIIEFIINIFIIYNFIYYYTIKIVIINIKIKKV